MIFGSINGQRLMLRDGHIAADTIDYLTARFTFNADWNGLEKWAHFAQGDTVYDIRLTDDGIRKEDHLNLLAGVWKVYLHGNEFADEKVIERITTSIVNLKVVPTGTLDGEPFPEMPASVTEQILARLDDIEQNGGTGGATGLPEHTAEDNNKILRIVDGDAAWTEDSVYVLGEGESADDAPDAEVVFDVWSEDGDAGETVATEVYMRVSGGYIQYSTDNATWKNVIAVADLKGDKGDPGQDGEDGQDGANGKDGVSATHSWNGTVLTVTSASGTSSADLKGDKGDTGEPGADGKDGQDGEPGANGITPHIGSNGNWYIGDTDTGVQAQGEPGKDGQDGQPGADGKDGEDYVLTGTDKSDIANIVLELLPAWEGGSY